MFNVLIQIVQLITVLTVVTLHVRSQPVNKIIQIRLLFVQRIIVLLNAILVIVQGIIVLRRFVFKHVTIMSHVQVITAQYPIARKEV